jgi:hypothetical protein
MKIRWNKEKLITAGVFVLIALAFGVAYTQSNLYESNQNTKFLHGIAQAGFGYLQQDWLAKTIDPLPVFSFLVYLTYSIDQNLFYLQYLILLGIYLFSLIGIASYLYGLRKSLPELFAFLGLIFLLHSRWVINMVGRKLGFDLELLHDGLAQQYLLGLEYQNSTFGVLILLSVFLFLKRSYFWAALCLGVAAILHSAYIFSAALVTLAFCLTILWENLKEARASGKMDRRALLQAVKTPFWVGLLILVMVIPVLWYNAVYLGPTSPGIFAQAMRIQVHERIPYHSLVSVWLNTGAYIQITIMLVGLILAWRSRLFPVVLALFLGGLIVTVIQVVTNSDDLAMLAPWRVSILLVPLSTALIAGWLVHMIYGWVGPRLQSMQWAVVLIGVVSIVAFTQLGWMLQQDYGTSYRTRRVGRMMDFAVQNAAPGQVYLVPPKENDYDNFRLYTGIPIYINWKSTPYKDVEYLQWYQRVQLADQFYNAKGPQRCDLLSQIVADGGVTDVVIQGKQATLDCPSATEVFRDTRYSVYALSH